VHWLTHRLREQARSHMGPVLNQKLPFSR